MNITTESFLDTTTDFISNETYIHPLLEPYNIVNPILAVIGIAINVAGVKSLLHQKKNRKECLRMRKILLISLSLSDIATCICVPLKLFTIFAFKQSNLHQTKPLVYSCTSTFFDVLVPAFYVITLLNLLGMAIDHWITFTKPFRYFVLMSKKRATIMISSFWIFGGIVAVSEYLVGLRVLNTELYGDLHLCELLVNSRVYKANYILLALAPICLVAMTMIYYCIFREIKLLVVAPPPLQDFGQAKRALFTTLIIGGTFLICWLPCFALTTALQMIFYHLSIGREVKISDATLITLLRIQQWSYSLLIINSILDPLVYMTYLRVKLKSLCQCAFPQSQHQYAAVMTRDKTKEEAVTINTLTGVRSSIQVSTLSNLMAIESEVNRSSPDWL